MPPGRRARAPRLFSGRGAGRRRRGCDPHLGWLYPGLKVAGVEAPELDLLSAAEHETLVARIRAARPDLLFAALGQPKGEFWLAANCRTIGVPVAVQVGASLDFVAGNAVRAPRWMQRTGLEWLYRMARDPWRLGPRYARNAWFLARMIGRNLAPTTRRGLARRQTGNHGKET